MPQVPSATEHAALVARVYAIEQARVEDVETLARAHRKIGRLEAKMERLETQLLTLQGGTATREV